MKLSEFARRPALQAISVMATAVVCGGTFMVSPADADIYDDANCEVSAIVDRKDGSTSTYAGGTLRCDRKVFTMTDVDVKLYKGETLRARGKASCGMPVHDTCGATSGSTPGSTGKWKAVITVNTSIEGAGHREVIKTVTKTW
ncbi:hypothetical protein AB0O76_36260 [Streptomyces sp. NPDC086554]|uniref:hypothetical protein n=1 Tax=Streptomyces sp. NPDC086554 TaxID=3154864 RepID=UPI0034431A25